MNVRRLLPVVLLTLLLGGTLLGVWLTRRVRSDAASVAEVTGGEQESRAVGSQKPPQKGKTGRQQRLVDTQSLLAARRLMAFAQTKEEQEYAKQAERLADHAVDLAFADAMRQAVENPPPMTPEVKALFQAREQKRLKVEESKKRIYALEQQLSEVKQKGASSDALQDRLEVDKAQWELDQDELTVATDDLERAGGDLQARIKRLKERFDAVQKEPRPLPPAAEELNRGTSFLEKWRAFAFQKNKYRDLLQARQAVWDRLKRMQSRREKLTQQLQQEGQTRGGVSPQNPSVPSPNPLQTIKQSRFSQRRLVELGKRMSDYQALGETYTQWMEKVETLKREALHEVFKALFWMVGVLALAWGLGRVAERFFHRVSQEDPGQRTLMTVVKFGVQLVAILVVVFLFVGTPSQTTTILGLAGAGLTVALKDFIVAFFGWFILMGRNGIRVGDWVEIRGVGGEVVEVGLLHTVLLETGNWHDAGHPTGRRVSFVNNFAIEGHYFNFSTSGQWMWDEITVLIPAGQDPYPVVDGVQKLVEEGTRANGEMAEKEWRQATTRYRVRTFSALPGVSVIPTAGGVELRVRYITRAFERHDTRRALNQKVLALMHGKRGEEILPQA